MVFVDYMANMYPIFGADTVDVEVHSDGGFGAEYFQTKDVVVHVLLNPASSNINTGTTVQS
jgi:hypothetical protein